jgi:uncharacterized LabA/DUF88 family protein
MGLSNSQSKEFRELFGWMPGSRVCIAIDHANIVNTCKNFNVKIDYERLYDMFAEMSLVCSASVYMSYTDADSGKFTQFSSKLRHIGYRVVRHHAKIQSGRTKANVDVTLATDVAWFAANNKFDRYILFTGDGDFSYLVSKIRESGSSVTIVSSRKGDNPICAQELYDATNSFVELTECGLFLETTQKSQQGEFFDDIYAMDPFAGLEYVRIDNPITIIEGDYKDQVINGVNFEHSAVLLSNGFGISMNDAKISADVWFGLYGDIESKNKEGNQS